MVVPSISRGIITPLSALCLVLGSVALAGCGSGRDEAMSEKLAAAQAAAKRAERAAAAAERAAAKLGVQPASATTEADHSSEADELAEEEPADQNPDSGKFDNVIESSPQPQVAANN